MKKILSLLTFSLLSLTLSFAQSTPTPPTPPKTKSTCSTKKNSKTRVNINIDSNQKLKLRADNQEIDMDLDFKKLSTIDIRKILTKHLGKPQRSSRGTEEWSDSQKSYKIKLKKGSLEASFDKEELSPDELDTMLSLTKNVFDELGWEVEVDGL